MILSAGLTPAWQQIMVFRSFRYGEVNRADEVHWHAQGKVLNAGIAAHHLGGPSLTLATLGGPPLEQIDREFAELGIPRRWIVTEASTRVCTTILDRTTGVMTELVENGKPLKPEELDEFRRVYAEEAARADVAVIAGSLPAGTPCSFYRELVERTPCPAVLDFRGEGLRRLDLAAGGEAEPRGVGSNRRPAVGRRPAITDAMRSLNRRAPNGCDHAAPGRSGWRRLPGPTGCTHRRWTRWSTRWAAATRWRPASLGRFAIGDMADAVRVGIAAARKPPPP